MINNVEKNEAVINKSASQIKNRLRLPLLALGFDILPIIIINISSYFYVLQSFTLLFMIVSPVAGVVTGVAYLARGRARTCEKGRFIAAAAVALPVICFAFIILFYVGVSTGLIILM